LQCNQKRWVAGALLPGKALNQAIQVVSQRNRGPAARESKLHERRQLQWPTDQLKKKSREPDLSQVVQSHFKIAGHVLSRAVCDSSHGDGWNSFARQTLHHGQGLHFGGIPGAGQPRFFFNRSNDSIEAKKPVDGLGPALDSTLKEPRIAPDALSLVHVLY
jgi:hypothetical protein